MGILFRDVVKNITFRCSICGDEMDYFGAMKTSNVLKDGFSQVSVGSLKLLVCDCCLDEFTECSDCGELTHNELMISNRIINFNGSLLWVKSPFICLWCYNRHNKGKI